MLFYDFKNTSALTPYVGVRLGVNRLEYQNHETTTTTFPTGKTVDIDTMSHNKTKVGYGAVAGVQYSINPKFAIDANVAYNQLGNLKWSDEEDTIKVKNKKTGLNIGLRYNF